MTDPRLFDRSDFGFGSVFRFYESSGDLFCSYLRCCCCCFVCFVNVFSQVAIVVVVGVVFLYLIGSTAREMRRLFCRRPGRDSFFLGRRLSSSFSVRRHRSPRQVRRKAEAKGRRKGSPCRRGGDGISKLLALVDTDGDFLEKLVGTPPPSRSVFTVIFDGDQSREA